MLKRFFQWIFNALFVPKEWRENAPSIPDLEKGKATPGDVDNRGRKGLPRGIRNNNPGNVEFNPKINWKGQVTTDGRFIIFGSAKWGIRCLVYNLNNYYHKYGLKTVAQMLDRWAPPFENNTNAYAVAVAKEMKIGINDRLVWNSAVKYQMAVAIMRHENGRDPLKYYDPELIREGVRLAG